MGGLALVLHAHLPYVCHPEAAPGERIEERWLFEAVTECYLPLLEVLQRTPIRLTLSLSPTLLAMWAEPVLRERYRLHLDGLVELADREVARTAGQGPVHAVAQMYQHRFRRCRRQYGQLEGDLARAFAALPHVELITCASTHAFLPLMAAEEAVRRQVRRGIEALRQATGRVPRGFWLPECAYCDGLDRILVESGIQWTILESHGVLGGEPPPRNGVYAPVRTPAGLYCFGRDPESSRQVWSAGEGYPGDYAYREFYRDIGFDLDADYVRPYIGPGGLRLHTGIKYHRITGPTSHKEIYDAEAAARTAARHAAHFVWCRERQLEHLRAVQAQDPLVVAPYDAELFGHWWFEGPLWLEEVGRRATFALLTPSDYLDRHREAQTTRPSLSSWGAGGYFDFWLNEKNHWMYRHLHAAAQRPLPAGPAAAAALRHLELAEASDWAFILSAGTATQYALERFWGHLRDFDRLTSASAVT